MRRLAIILLAVLVILSGVYLLGAKFGAGPVGEPALVPGRPGTSSPPKGSDRGAGDAAASDYGEVVDAACLPGGYPEPPWLTPAEFEAVAPLLAAAGDPDLELAALMMDRGDDVEIAASQPVLERLLERGSRNPLVVTQLLYSCFLAGSSSGCISGRYESLAIEALGNNGYVRAILAGLYDWRGDYEAALQELIRAANAPQYDDYTLDRIILFKDALAAAGIGSPYQRIAAAWNLEKSSMGIESALQELCDERAPRDDNWLVACLDMGRRMEAEGRTLKAESTGRGLQKKVHEISGDAAALLLVVSREEAWESRLAGYASEAIGAAMLSDPNFVDRYIEQFAAHGERGAMLAVLDVAERKAAELCPQSR